LRAIAETVAMGDLSRRRKSAIQCSKIFFKTMIEADRAGKAALVSLLSEQSD
jgi:hypothetical protein